MGTVGFFGLHTSLHDLPGPVQDRARVSAEQARQAATAIHRPDLAHAADDAFIHADGPGTGAGGRREVSRYVTTTACSRPRRAVLMSPLTPWTGSWVTWRAPLASRPTA